MVHQPAGPSSKALGKRPVRNAAATPSPLSTLTPSADSTVPDDETDDCSLAPSAGSMQTRLNHKRVLPSRVRRGGVGSLVGTNDIDVNILDMLKRKGENDPLIPARTVFVLTTDSSKVPSASTSEIGLNQLANERYFERPEVIRAYKNQQNIQVPEFIQMEEEMVGGRLRARSGEVEFYGLSDAAYEKRHRKHEMIEKRQRLREKEKLQHEHYKLKERIDQLRTMDYNAFLALPDDIFGSVETAMGPDLPDGTEAGIGSAASLHEAERRRKLMLDVAISLEERYRTLLPPERRPAEARLVTRPSSASVEPSIPDEDADNISIGPDQDGAASVASNRSKPPKLKLKLQATAQLTPPPTAAGEPLRRQRGAPVVDESPPALPEVEPLENSITVTASHSMSSRQTRSRAGPRAGSPHHLLAQAIWQGQIPVVTVPDAFALSNHALHISTNNPNQFFSADHLESNGTTLTLNNEGMVPISRVQEASAATPNNTRQRYATVTQRNQLLNVIPYISPPEQEPSRKKKKSFHVSVDDMAPSHDQDIDRASEPPDRITDIQYYTPATTAPEQTEHSAQARRPVISTTPQPEEAPSEPFESEASVPIAHLEPYVKSSRVPSSLSSEERSVPFAQLRQLEQPDQAGDFGISEQTDLYDTSTADEPFTPPWEPVSTPHSLTTEAHHTFLVPTALEPVNKRRRRQSTPYARREPSASLPPGLSSSTSLSIVSMQSYDIPVPVGTRKKLKPLGGLLAASRHNEEPGRKTGRSVKAFGIEVPSFEGKEEEVFELPSWMIREVLAERIAETDSDGESDGDPPSFVAGMAHGEAQHGTFPDSISATGYLGADRQ